MNRLPPLVTVYISTHNRFGKLKRAISSVLNQDYPNIEIIVCDDGSSDETEAYLNELMLKHDNIVYKRNRIPEGACSARNLGIFSASGEFITGLDDDDEFTPSRITTFVNCWQDRYSFVCSNFKNVYSSGKQKDYYRGADQVIRVDDLLLDNIASNQVFTKTYKLQAIGGFDTTVARLQDWDTWLRLSKKFGAGLRLAQSLYIMHHDEADATRVSRNMTFSTALHALYERNKSYYDKKYEFLVRSKIRLIQRRFTLMDMIKCCGYKKSVKPLFQFLIQFIKKID